MRCLYCLSTEPHTLMEDFPEIKTCPNCGRGEEE